MSNNPIFVVFEGLDGSGKSTLSKETAKEIGAQRTSTPSREMSECRKVIDEQYKNCGLASQLFYASTVAHASNYAKECLERGKSVVMDRYIASTLAYDKCIRDSGLSEEFWMEHIFKGIMIPHVIIYVEVSPEKHKEYNEKRGENNDTDRKSIKKRKELEGRYDTVFTMLKKSKWKIEAIENNGEINTAVKECVEIVNSHCEVLG